MCIEDYKEIREKSLSYIQKRKVKIKIILTPVKSKLKGLKF